MPALTSIRTSIATVLVSMLVLAHPPRAAARLQHMPLTAEVPACRMPAAKVLPDKYYALAKKNKEFAWVRKASADDHEVSGNGWERVDGSSMFTWFAFSRVDLNNDGLCDWFVHAAAPISTGGNRDSINTLYLGRKNGWQRIGAAVPADKPDELGFGKTEEEQGQYLFGEEFGVIHDPASKTNYLVGAFYNRHEHASSKPGYLIQVGDKDRHTLRLLDKWDPTSKAAAVYAFFKAHGARMPASTKTAPQDTIERFDPEIEALEREQACNPDSPQRASPKLYGAVSPYLLARCKGARR
jgi:hypothetical protein